MDQAWLGYVGSEYNREVILANHDQPHFKALMDYIAALSVSKHFRANTEHIKKSHQNQLSFSKNVSAPQLHDGSELAANHFSDAALVHIFQVKAESELGVPNRAVMEHQV